MSLTPDGLVIKRFTEIVSDIQTRLNDTNTNILITDESNKTANNVSNAIILSLAEIYEFAEEVYNSFDVRSAEGVSLDRLVIFKNIKRESAEFSTGLVEFFANKSVKLTNNVIARDTRGRNLICVENREIGTGIFRSINLSYNSSDLAIDNRTYFLLLNNIEYTYIASSGDTLEVVCDNLATQINNDSDYNATNTNGLLSVSRVNVLNFTAVLDDIFTLDSYSSLVLFRSETQEPLQFPENTVTTLVTTLSGVTSINNPRNFDQGRLEETDEELRERFLNTTGAVSKATVDSIIKGVSQVDGVDDVSLLNNIEDAVSPEGLPPKSFEVIVQGGEDQDIADAILAFAPAGIESFGNVSTTAIDSQGTIQPISFTRPENLYIFVNVVFEKYEEFNNFPVDGIELIKEALVNNGQNFKPNLDVIPSRLNSPIYANVQGVGDILITCGSSKDASASSPDSGFSSNTLPVELRDIAIFEAGRITVTEGNVP